MEPGDSRAIAGHTVELVEVVDGGDAAKAERKAMVRIDGGQIYAPALQKFPNGSQQIGRPSVRSTPIDDVYLALLDAPNDGPIRLRVIVAPLVIWLWIGGGVIALGSVMAAFPGRRRRGVEPVSADAAPDDLDRHDREPVGVGG
jgi:cytochrome c-type biogenesis protein CcmF